MAGLVHLLPFLHVIEGVKGRAGVLIVPELIQADNGAGVQHDTSSGRGPETAFMEVIRDVKAAE